jgi:hypothetical protein
MATQRNTSPAELLDGRLALPAAAASIVVGLAGAAALVWFILARQPSAAVVAYCIVLVGAMLIPIVGGAYLARRQVAAQQALLAFFLAVAVVGLGGLVTRLLGGEPAWWSQQFSFSIMWVTQAMLAAGLLVSGLLVMASSAGTRLRYASTVAVSVAVAAALLLVVNVVGQRDSFRKNVESLGQYRLSERSRLILADIKEPVKVSIVYGAGPTKKTSHFNDRLMELLEEMRRVNPNVQYDDASGDAAKARLLERLTSRVAAEAKAHDKFLRSFRDDADGIIAAMKSARDEWAKLPSDACLGKWEVYGALDMHLSEGIDMLEDAHRKVRRELSGSGMPDYAAVTKPLAESLKELSQQIDKDLGDLRKLATVPAAAANASEKTQDALDALRKASAAFVANAEGTAQSPATAPATRPMDPAAAKVRNALAAMEQLADAMEEAAQQLSLAAGEDNKSLIGGFEPLTVGVQTSIGIPMSYSLGSYFRVTARALRAQHERFESGFDPAAKADEFNEQLTALKTLARRNSSQTTQLLTLAAKGLAELAQTDEPSRRLLDAAGEGKPLSAAMSPLKQLAASAAALPELKESTLAKDLAKDNVIVVEAAGKTEVLDFGDVWPVKVSANPMSRGQLDEVDKRWFSGDSVISSRLLGMTHKPFGRILLAHAAVPPELAQRMMMMGGGRSPAPEDFATLKTRLEQANFKVQPWDLAAEMPAYEAKDPASKDDTSPATRPTTATSRSADEPPTVVLVLPPTTPYTDEQFEHLKAGIAAASGAIVLAGHTLDRPLDPSLTDYLSESWGVTIRNSYCLVPVVPDDVMPGEYRVEVLKFQYLPVSSFTEHPIGRPLQGQRMLWAAACPVDAASKPPAGVRTASVLDVPAYQSVWATADIRDLVEKVQSERPVSPQWERGDRKPPFSLAMASSRDDGKGRVVVLGVGMSMLEQFLAGQVPVVGSQGQFSLEPAPTADADVVVNSAYWIAGRDGMIASGPVRVKPVQTIDNPLPLQLLLTLGLPAAVMMIGVLVMLIRRR